jgi:trigger factor
VSIAETKTETNTETKNDCKREIEVLVPAAEVARQTEVIIQKFQKLARIPGFRKGHVPATVIRQRFAEDIKSEVVEALVPQHFRKETDRQGLYPVSQPQVTDLHIHDGEPLRFKASFEVMPEIPVEGYKELRAEHPEIVVTDDEVNQAIQDLREQHATYTPIEGRTLAEGEFAQVSLEGNAKDGGGASIKDSAPIKMDEILVEIGGKNTLPEFTENLRGASAGDERTFDVKYADDYSDKRLAGTTFSYTVKVQALKQKALPELNDEFAKELGNDFQTFAQVQQRIREQMEKEKRQAIEREGKEKLMAELVKRNQFAVPEALVERQVDLRLERGLRALAAQGMKPEDMKGMDFGRLRAGQREGAEQEVKSSLLLERIAELEKLEVSDEEVDREIANISAQTKQTPEAVRARLTEDGALDRIRHRIRNEKALEFLYRQSA